MATTNRKIKIVVLLNIGLVCLLMSCAGQKYRRQVEIQKQEIAELKVENTRLKSDCARLYANSEVLVGKLNELQGGARTTGTEYSQHNESLIGRLKDDGLNVVIREGNPAVLVSGIFKTGKSSLTSAGQASLRKTAQIIARVTPDTPIRIDGYTDDRGSSETNRKIALARAEAVKNFLIQTCDFKADLVTVQGLGEVNPIANNKTPAGREKNRRIEIVILAK
jgi:outer membrane protein OmpA-like peptidoglycan-associated protein